MALRDDLLPMIDELRALPGELGFRPYTSVRIRARTWTGERPGDGTSSDAFVALTTGGQPAKVERLSGRQVAASAGRYLDGDLRVGPLTPTFVAPSQLDPSSNAPNVERHLVLEGPGEPAGGSVWTIIERDVSRSISWYLIVRRTERTA